MTELQALWWPAFAVFFLGTLGGVLLVVALPPNRDDDETPPNDAVEPPSGEAQLTSSGAHSAEYKLTIGALRALEAERGGLASDFYAREKARLEALAVSLLKAAGAPAGQRPPPSANDTHKISKESRPRRQEAAWLRALRARPNLQRFAWLLVVVATGGVLTLNLRDAAHAELASEPAAMGAAPMGGPEGVSRQELAQLKGRLEDNPSDVDALLRVAHLALRAQQFDDAAVFNDRALSLEPASVEGRVHKAMFLAKDGDVAGAMASLTALTKEHQGFAEAWFFRGMLSMQQGDMDTMRESFGQFLVVAPDGPQKDRVRAMLGRQKT